MHNDERPPVLIVGAGLSGLVAANTLAAHGRRALVLDKSGSPGGRLATRRMAGVHGKVARLDHGAQFFTVRSPDFAEIVHDWRRAGIVREWCRGFAGPGDGHPRYCAEAGMNTIAKYLASTVDVICDVKIHAVAGNNGALSVLTSDGRRWESDTVLLTSPVPQSLDLCANGWLPIPEVVDRELQAISYVPCLALLVTLNGPSDVRHPGGLQLDEDSDSTFSFVADNEMKGISDVSALTFHVNDRVSIERYDDDADEVKSLLLAKANHYFGSSTVINSEVKKWRFARPLVGHPLAHVSVSPVDDTQLVFAGDAFGGAKVEGAALSGLSAAESILLRG